MSNETALNRLFAKIKDIVKEYENMNPSENETEQAKKIVRDICQGEFKDYPYIDAIESYTVALISEVRGK